MTTKKRMERVLFITKFNTNTNPKLELTFLVPRLATPALGIILVCDF